MSRHAKIERNTAETQIRLEVELDGQGKSTIRTGVGFFDHMLTLFAKHAAVDLTLDVDGDLHVDAHHTVEDVGIALGTAVREALGNKSGIRRYGFFTLPMDETLVSATIDLSGRAWFVYNVTFTAPKVGEFDTELVHEFWQAFAANCLCNLHLNLHYGQNTHHVAEGTFKAAARALRQAMEPDPRVKGVPSTKGTL